MRMDPGNSQLNSWLYNNVWNGKNYQYDFPSPYGIMEDEGSVFAWIYVGGSGSAQVSTEYGRGTSPSGFADEFGSSSYHDDTDYETALGIFVNGTCRSICHNVGFNGLQPEPAMFRGAATLPTVTAMPRVLQA